MTPFDSIEIARLTSDDIMTERIRLASFALFKYIPQCSIPEFAIPAQQTVDRIGLVSRPPSHAPRTRPQKSVVRHVTNRRPVRISNVV